jgi:signal transduction histidine kinase
MKKEEVILIIAVLLLLAAVAGHILSQLQLKRTYSHLNAMLDEAIMGEFKESSYDESQISRVSVKLKRFLAASQLSSNNLNQEKERVKGLISDISHQTRTPITSIILYTQLLAEDEKLDAEERSKLQMITRYSEKLDFLIQALVKTSRLETGIITVNPTRELLNSAVSAALEEVSEKAANKNIAIVNQIEGNHYAFFDLKWTVEAIYNILDNAVKYTGNGQTVTISVKDYEMFVCLSVTDTGRGIPEDEVNKIYSRFYRGAGVTEQEGVGIGLYLARKIMMEQQGYIKVASKVNQGTTFSLFFAEKGK